MPILSRIGRRHWRVRLLILAIYLVLIVGSIAMIYPFAVMVSGSFKSPVDVHDYDVIPKFLYDDAMLFRKYVEERYNESIGWMNGSYRTGFNRFEDVLPPAVYSKVLVDEWRAFLESDGWDAVLPDSEGRIPLTWFQLGAYTAASFKKPQAYQIWTRRLADRFGDVRVMNRQWGTNYPSFLVIGPIAEMWDNRRFVPESNPLYADFAEMKRELRARQPRFLLPISCDAQFLSTYIWPKYGREIQAYNETHGTRHPSYSAVILSERAPSSPATREEWMEYASDDWRIRNVRLRNSAQEAFRRFLLERYGSAEALGLAYGIESEQASLFSIPEPVTPDTGTPIADDFRAFLAQAESCEGLYLLTVEDWSRYVRDELHTQFIRVTPDGERAFREYLLKVYGSGEDPSAAPVDVFANRYGDKVVQGASSLEEAVSAFQLRQPVPPGEPVAVDFSMFLVNDCPLDAIRLVTLDILFARYLEKKYENVAALEAAIRASLAHPSGSREELAARLSPLGNRCLAVLEELGIENSVELFRAIEDDLKSCREDEARPTLLDRLEQPSLDHLKQDLTDEDRNLLTQIRRLDAFLSRRPTAFREYHGQEYARDWEDLQFNRKAIRKEFLVTNYRVVMNFILFHGRALYNTAVFVVGMIVCTLVINPLAAYALSRFQLPSTYKILLFFMATMAFPAEVTMIPSFLLLKNFPLGYLLQMALCISVFLGARYALAMDRPVLWKTIETAVVLLIAAVALATTVLPAAGYASLASIRPAGLGAYALAAASVLAAFVWAAPRLPGAWARGVARYETAALATLAGVLGILTAPMTAKAAGYDGAEVSLLNTFWALILPSIANGYAIFLLKGFFDSLPQTLYESAQIEGAREMWMFRNVTLPLSKPILAVIALQTFNLAYTTFMYAFVVCQDPKMWTLMVWLYDLQADSPQFVIFASLVVAAVPTLVVFILAQRVIMRGIIIPVEK